MPSKSIHVVTDKISFSFMANNILMCVCMCVLSLGVCLSVFCLLFILLSIHGHLVCFYILTIINSAAIAKGVYISFQVIVFFFNINTKKYNCWII